MLNFYAFLAHPPIYPFSLKKPGAFPFSEQKQ